VAVAAFLGFGTVRAAGDSLPDSPLYPVRVLAEDVQVGLASPEVKPQLYAAQASSRAEDAKSLQETGRSAEAERTASEAFRRVEDARAVAAQVPEMQRPQVSAKVESQLVQVVATIEDISPRIMHNDVAQAVSSAPSPTRVPLTATPSEVAALAVAPTPEPTATPLPEPTHTPTGIPVVAPGNGTGFAPITAGGATQSATPVRNGTGAGSEPAPVAAPTTSFVAIGSQPETSSTPTARPSTIPSQTVAPMLPSETPTPVRTQAAPATPTRTATATTPTQSSGPMSPTPTGGVGAPTGGFTPLR